MKDKIILYALRLFDEHGYHGMTMRELCKAVGCTMPTIYYHFKDKEALFDVAVRQGFEEMVDEFDERCPRDLPHKEISYYRVLDKKHLTEKQRLIYRLAIKTWLGFEGCEAIREKFRIWEQARYESMYSSLVKETPSRLGAKFIARCVTNLIERIVLQEEDIPDEEVRAEIDMIYHGAALYYTERQG